MRRFRHAYNVCGSLLLKRAWWTSFDPLALQGTGFGMAVEMADDTASYAESEADAGQLWDGPSMAVVGDTLSFGGATSPVRGLLGSAGRWPR